MTKGIIFYTANEVPKKLADEVMRRLAATQLPAVSVSINGPCPYGRNYQKDWKRGSLTMFKQQLLALEHSDADIIFMCEADVLYPKEHFDFTPPEKDKFYYNNNWWSVGKGDMAVTWDANRVSQLCCYREHALEFYRKRVKHIEEKGFDRSYEPGGRDESLYERWESSVPTVDVLHGNNLTARKWDANDFRDKSTGQNFQESTIDKIEGWDNIAELLI